MLRFHKGTVCLLLICTVLLFAQVASLVVLVSLTASDIGFEVIQPTCHSLIIIKQSFAAQKRFLNKILYLRCQISSSLQTSVKEREKVKQIFSSWYYTRTRGSKKLPVRIGRFRNCRCVKADSEIAGAYKQGSKASTYRTADSLLRICLRKRTNVLSSSLMFFTAAAVVPLWSRSNSPLKFSGIGLLRCRDLLALVFSDDDSPVDLSIGINTCA